MTQTLPANPANYIEEVYMVLKPEEIFAKAKEYSWQTFFHHSASVAAASYRLGTLIKKNLSGIHKLAVKSIEKEYGTYEIILFLAGLAHDYVKLYGTTKSKTEERIKEILRTLVNNIFTFEIKNADILIPKLVHVAIAVEGIYDTELDENFIEYVAKVVRVIDTLLSLTSIEDALTYIMSSNDFSKLSNDYGIKVAYLMVSTPSMLHARVSEAIINIVMKHNWVPLVVYYDGVLFIGDSSSSQISMGKVIEVFRKEVASAFKLEDRLRGVLSRLKNLSLASIYRKLVQSGASTTLPINIKELKKNRDYQEILYHNIIVKYLSGTPLSILNKEITDVRTKAKIRGSIIDARRLATGIRKGSTYFSEILATIVTPKDELADFVESITDEEEKFLILAYMTAFASKDERATVKILEKALNIKLPTTTDKELIRIIGIAEAFKAIKNKNAVKTLVKTCFEVLGGTSNIDYYIMRYILSRIKSNIINTEKLRTHNILANNRTHSNYCRICGTPLLESSIPMIQYAQTINVVKGGASEIWLHDDPPLANLEQIATTKETRIRYICPICYYEATYLREKYRPPFLVVSLHPTVAYDLWQYMRAKLNTLASLYYIIRTEKKFSELAKLYRSLLHETNLKLTKEIISKLRGKASGNNNVIILFDAFGARAYIPMEERDMSAKRKDVAYILALAPLFLSALGGGQIGFATTLGDAYNLGVEIAPITVPHKPRIIHSIIQVFEAIRTSRRRQGINMTLDEYAIYNMSYITLLKALYVYGLRVLGWYSLWRKRGGKKNEFEYALDMLEYMNSISYVPLALNSPPPERLDPREGDEELPHYKLISKLTLEVESSMSQAQKIVEKKEPPLLNKLLYRYATSLKEFKSDLSKYKVQRPLRKAIDILLQYSPALGEDAKGLAMDKFLELVSSTTGVNLERAKKKVTDKSGKVKEVSYRAIFFDIFDNIANIITKLKSELPPSQLRKFVEIMLDSAYEKYKHV